MITVRLPATLRGAGPATIAIEQTAATVAALIDLLDERMPGFRDQVDDALFNFAVNDEMLLHRARERRLADGDVVEVVPAISGG